MGRCPDTDIDPVFLVKFNNVSVLHIPIVHAHDVSKQIPLRKKEFKML